MNNPQYAAKQLPLNPTPPLPPHSQQAPGLGVGINPSTSHGLPGHQGTGVNELLERAQMGYSASSEQSGAVGGSSDPRVGFTGQRQPAGGATAAALEIFELGNHSDQSMLEGEGSVGQHRLGRGPPSNLSSGRSSAFPPIPAALSGPPRRSQIDFPVLPPSDLHPHQTFQTPHQVQSILSLPTSLLLNLARTKDLSQQVQIANAASATWYLPSMSLPPPPPDQLVSSITGQRDAPPVTQISDHPAIPILLGQAFSPPTPGIAVQSNPITTNPFKLIFASVEDWSLKAARAHVSQSKAALASAGPSRPPLHTTHSFNEREIEAVASQLKTWALKEQEKQVHEQVISSKEAAVLLATQAAARMNVAGAVANHASQPGSSSASRVQSNGSSMIEAAVQGMDLTPYADQYRIQLDALASGYFVQLHREALNRLMSAAETPTPTPFFARQDGIFPSSQPPSTQFNQQLVGTTQLKAMYVQAAAAAAIASNALAATEILSLVSRIFSDLLSDY